MEAVVRRLCLNKAGGYIHLHADHLNKWLQEAYLDEGKFTPLKPEFCKNLVGLTQYMWQHREIPKYLGGTILFLTPNGKTNTQGIGLLKTLWKVVEEINNTHTRTSISFHDVLHGFRAGKGTCISILDIKLAQELASVYKEPLLLVFIYLQKTYANVDRGRFLTTL